MRVFRSVTLHASNQLANESGEKIIGRYTGKDKANMVRYSYLGNLGTRYTGILSILQLPLKFEIASR